MLYVEPYGGLCNRMRCISSAYRYAEVHNIELTIVWCALNELNCDFKSLFSLCGDVKTNVISIPYIDEKFLRRVLYRLISKLIKKTCVHSYQEDIMEANKDNLDSCYIRSCANWYPTENPYAMFQPNTNWYMRVIDFMKQNDENILGVHIRRTDNSVSVEASPLEAFYVEIDKFLNEEVKQSIYVASDDQQVIEQLILHYPEVNVTYLKNVDRRRNSKQGILDAVVELYILANCKAIIGSYYSSYTDTAADINGIDKYIARFGDNA